MRKEESGFPAKVKAGYGSASASRGLHPRGLIDSLVWREADLEKLDPKRHIVRIAHRVGEKKRLGIVEKAKQQNFHIANPGKEEARPVAEQPAAEEKAIPAVAEDNSASNAEDAGEKVEAPGMDEVPSTTEESE